MTQFTEQLINSNNIPILGPLGPNLSFMNQIPIPQYIQHHNSQIFNIKMVTKIHLKSQWYNPKLYQKMEVRQYLFYIIFIFNRKA